MADVRSSASSAVTPTTNMLGLHNITSYLDSIFKEARHLKYCLWTTYSTDHLLFDTNKPDCSFPHPPPNKATSVNSHVDLGGQDQSRCDTCQWGYTKFPSLALVSSHKNILSDKHSVPPGVRRRERWASSVSFSTSIGAAGYHRRLKTATRARCFMITSCSSYF
jgi:hypothetical protein